MTFQNKFFYLSLTKTNEAKQMITILINSKQLSPLSFFKLPKERKIAHKWQQSNRIINKRNEENNLDNISLCSTVAVVHISKYTESSVK